MISLYGTYEDGKIKLAYDTDEPLPDNQEVIITFLDVEGSDGPDRGTKKNTPIEGSEEYYESIREFERVKAYGSITIIDDDDKFTFPLNDYSQGGLSFFSDKKFRVGHNISAGIADPTNPDLILMELEMEVRGIFQVEDHEDEDRYKVGCMFIDSVDEDLWHGLLQYLS